MFNKVLIANRGEITVRIARTCTELGVATVAVFSDVDAEAKHVKACDESIALPGISAADTYLRSEVVIAAALEVGAQAIHPGYGFLAENAGFAEEVIAAGLVWIGPPPDATRALGDKIEARRIAASSGVPVVPGITEPVRDLGLVYAFGKEHGYPVAVKAAGGGGGRGLRVAFEERQVPEAFAAARREAEAYFSSADVYAERYLDAPKHLEVQILAPSSGDAMWLGVRDCSLQRRHQKLIEESPPPLHAERAEDMGAAAVAVSTACGYVGAGTVEMLVDEDGCFYFLEVNARLQVEHTVTEQIFGIDLVACQLLIAAGDPLGFAQTDLVARGHAIECRINAEDPARDFAPTPGVITVYEEPKGVGLRVDSGYGAGDEVPGAYDSLIAKIIAWGPDREDARERLLAALGQTEIEGIATTIPAHRALLELDEFVAGKHTTVTVVESGVLGQLSRAAPDALHEAGGILLVDARPVRLWNPAMAASVGGVSRGELVAPMQGTIVKVLVTAGAEVAPGDPVAVLEAMKMATTVTAARAGTVREVLVAAGDTATSGQVLAVIE